MILIFFYVKYFEVIHTYLEFFTETMFSKNSASRQSLPNMHVDTESTEDSTESLLDESEECVRKSIDTTLTLIDWPCVGYRYVGRTYSVPNLFLGIFRLIPDLFSNF